MNLSTASRLTLIGYERMDRSGAVYVRYTDASLEGGDRRIRQPLTDAPAIRDGRGKLILRAESICRDHLVWLERPSAVAGCDDRPLRAKRRCIGRKRPRSCPYARIRSELNAKQ